MEYLELTRYCQALQGLDGAFHYGFHQGQIALDAGAAQRIRVEQTPIEVALTDLEDAEWFGHIPMFVERGYQTALDESRTVAHPVLMWPNLDKESLLRRTQQWRILPQTDLFRFAATPQDLAEQDLANYLKRNYPIGGKTPFGLHMGLCPQCSVHPFNLCSEGKAEGLKGMYQRYGQLVV